MKAKFQLNRTNYPYPDYLLGKICQGWKLPIFETGIVPFMGSRFFGVVLFWGAAAQVGAYWHEF